MTIVLSIIGGTALVLAVMYGIVKVAFFHERLKNLERKVTYHGERLNEMWRDIHHGEDDGK